MTRRQETHYLKKVGGTLENRSVSNKTPRMRRQHKKSLTLSILFSAALFSLLSANEPNMIEDYRWSHRLVFIFTEAEKQPALVEKLTSEKRAINERDIRWFCWSPDRLETNEASLEDPESLLSGILNYRKKPDAATEVILVGKDGGVKWRTEKLALPEIFARIDRMPMRQAEMRAAQSERR